VFEKARIIYNYRVDEGEGLNLRVYYISKNKKKDPSGSLCF